MRPKARRTFLISRASRRDIVRIYKSEIVMASLAMTSFPFDEENDKNSSYCDFMVIGKTGQGKSRLSNLLLGIDPEKKCLLETPESGEGINDVITRWECNADGKPYFETGEGVESVTKHNKVLSNEISNNRVLDTIGFADSGLTKEYGVVEGNLYIFRRILQVQRQCDLRFTRVVYFLPFRATEERSDGNLQEEIEVMHSYFGSMIFDIMVLIATNTNTIRHQRLGFEKEDVDQVERVFMHAYHRITGEEQSRCPPVVYVPLSLGHKELVTRIVGAPVISDAHVLAFSPEFPICRERKGVELKFTNRCTRCGIRIEYQTMKNGSKLPVKVVDKNGDREEYDNSYCHPLFIPEYTVLERFFGGVAHIATLGTFKIAEWVSRRRVRLWPGFFDWDEKCLYCKKPPGSVSCCPVNQYTTIGEKPKEKSVFVDHTTELDKLKVVDIPESTQV